MRAEERRPLLRGYFHLAAACLAVAGLVLLMLLAQSPRAVTGGAVFAVSLIMLYSTSAIYHTITWGGRMRALLKRLDHSMIFVFIAGSYTPFCLLALDEVWGLSLLGVIWPIALAGVVLKLVWPGAPRWLSVLVYASAGWLGIVAAVPLAHWLALAPLLLLLAGGILYTAGGVIYAVRRPDPFPKVFGYHEVFHLFVVAGSAIHFSLVAIYLMPA